jgi:hypothetical protein
VLIGSVVGMMAASFDCAVPSRLPTVSIREELLAA